MKSKVRCGSGGVEFGCLVILFVRSGSALIESHSSISRSSFSSNYTSLSPFVLPCFASLFLFWLGSAIDHQRALPHYYAFLLATKVQWSKLADFQAEFFVLSDNSEGPRRLIHNS